jgi:hypothetical protein
MRFAPIEIADFRLCTVVMRKQALTSPRDEREEDQEITPTPTFDE